MLYQIFFVPLYINYNNMKILIGKITDNGRYVDVDGTLYILPIRGVDEEGYPEILIDSKSINGKGTFTRQSSKPLVGMNVEFVTNNELYGFNFKII